VSPARAPKPSCIFCSIIQGTLPAETVVDTPEVLAILDHRPLFPGHCLVLPRTHQETLLDLPEDALAPLFTVVQRLGRAMETALGAHGSFVAINNRVSQSVPHVHVHVVPRREKDGLFARGMVWTRKPYPDSAAMAAMGARLRAALLAEGGGA
jgi:histidine triad (HIT) family protein